MNKYSGFWMVGLLWLLATTLNFSKAVHIDDTFHLKAAQWIADNPIRPMSACINWGDDIQDMYCSSQPALYFYLMAISGSLSGWSIHALHGMQSIFTLLALCFFFMTARNIAPRFANWLTIILGTNAAFLVNQNLMVDMPILAMGMMVLFFSLKPNPRSGDFAMANIAIGLSFLMKYTSIAFAPIIALSILLRKKWWMVLWVAIPGGLFLLWSALNYYEYHRIHLINRVPEPFDMEVFKQKMISFVMVIGGVSPFIITFFFRWVNGSAKMVWIAISVLLMLIIFYVLGFYSGYFSQNIAKLFLINIFLVAGICLILLSVWLFVSRIFIRDSDRYSLSTANMLILFLGFISMTVFVIWFAPFMATRHVLLVLPFLLLLWAGELAHVPAIARWTGLLLNAVLGILLCIEDVRYSKDYERYAEVAQQLLPNTAHSWVLGHWGFQWYMEQKGYPVYETSFSKVLPGDYFLVPRNFSVQNIAKHIELSEPMHWVSKPAMLLNIRNFASLYASPYPTPVWYMNSNYQDTLTIYRVVGVDQP